MRDVDLYERPTASSSRGGQLVLHAHNVWLNLRDPQGAAVVARPVGPALAWSGQLWRPEDDLSRVSLAWKFTSTAGPNSPPTSDQAGSGSTRVNPIHAVHCPHDSCPLVFQPLPHRGLDCVPLAT